TLGGVGAHAVVWGPPSAVVRQRAVPDAVLGRVGGVYRVAIQGGMVIGTPIGGLLARSFGITAPFWFGFFGSALLVALLWREFDHIVHAGDPPGGSGGPAIAAGRGAAARPPIRSLFISDAPCPGMYFPSCFLSVHPATPPSCASAPRRPFAAPATPGSRSRSSRGRRRCPSWRRARVRGCPVLPSSDTSAP